MNRMMLVCVGCIVLLALPACVEARPATSLREIVDDLTESAKNVVEGLIFLSFIIGLGLYTIPVGPWEEWSARGKALMTRAVTAQVIYSLSSLIFNWLSTIGS